jgi:putative ABC transport system permease protein
MTNISVFDLMIGLIPVAVTLIIMFRWSMTLNKALLSIVRMLIQLLLIGYALNFIFNAHSSWIIVTVLCVMLLAASWISMSSIQLATRPLLLASLASILIGGVFTLVVTTQGVLQLDPWYSPQVIIPIAGMIFSNSMTTISLAAERFYSEYQHQPDYHSCRNIAYQAALIPVFNSLLAVGLVSLPGMMTGQILSGVSPLVAARYQIMVMLMIFGSSGISAAIFLAILKNHVDSGLTSKPAS